VDISSIYQELTGVLNKVFDDDSIVVRPELTAQDVEEWDSLSHIRLMLAVENTSKVRFSASEIGKLKTVGDLAGLIQSKVA